MILTQEQEQARSRGKKQQTLELIQHSKPNLDKVSVVERNITIKGKFTFHCPSGYDIKDWDGFYTRVMTATGLQISGRETFGPNFAIEFDYAKIWVNDPIAFRNLLGFVFYYYLEPV